MTAKRFKKYGIEHGYLNKNGSHKKSIIPEFLFIKEVLKQIRRTERRLKRNG